MSEPERWLPGDVVLAADGCIWWRPAIIAGFPWNLVYAADPNGPKHRSATSERVPGRPLTLLVRNGKPCSGLTDTTGMPVPVRAVQAALASLEGQLADVARDHREMRTRLRVLSAVWAKMGDFDPEEFATTDRAFAIGAARVYADVAVEIHKVLEAATERSLPRTPEDERVMMRQMQERDDTIEWS